MSYPLDAEEYLQNQIWQLLPTPKPHHIEHLAVIGNGLDLAVGIDSRYMNFREYFLNEAERSNQLGDSSLQNIYQQIEEITETDWSDFETALASVNLPSYVSELEYLDAGDLSEMDQLTTEGTEYGETFTSLLSQMFCEWVRKEVSPQPPQHKPFSIAQLIHRAQAFITFNYTTTLQRHFGVPDSQILHIHGTSDSESGPYFGCPEGVTPTDQGGNYGISYSVRIQAHRQLIDQLIKRPRVDLIHAFLGSDHSLKSISSYGFSYGEADFDYVNAIISHTDQNSEWINYCYGKSGQQPEDTAIASSCHEILRDLGYRGKLTFQSA
ncbi:MULTISPECIES: AbiH family protein [unclassified Brevibacterium]|uniref:AbiH family protein n=1 Tax=unclassified Brevibacterium TaxID=2614124 RepID=UPI0010923881|nr:AbiH family protein [Brevibacterium sp. S22]TGD28207.1 hypothetical protein EB835_17645 [Brevibacterium sp. S22]